MPLTIKERAQAKHICSRCPVRVQCLTHAISTGEYWGIWGGLDERERRSFVKEHKGRKQAIASLKTTKPAS